MKSSLILPGILTVAALLTACGTGSEVTEPSAATASPESVAATTTQDAPATESTVSAVASPAAPAALNAFAPPEGAPELTLQDIRVGSHEAYDRVVFEFSGDGLPGYRIQYTDKALQQASGHELAVSGNDILEVLIEGTPMDRLPSNPDLISAGPYQLATGNVAGITNGGTFENQSQFFIGLDRQRSCEAPVLERPTRRVIDVHR